MRVKLPEAEREDLHALEDLVIRTPTGTEVPLLDVVEIDRGEAFSTINRRDGRRVVSVSMDVEPKRAITQVIAALRTEVLPQLAQDFPGVTWTFEGSNAFLSLLLYPAIYLGFSPRKKIYRSFFGAAG